MLRRGLGFQAQRDLAQTPADYSIHLERNVRCHVSFSGPRSLLRSALRFPYPPKPGALDFGPGGFFDVKTGRDSQGMTRADYAAQRITQAMNRQTYLERQAASQTSSTDWWKIGFAVVVVADIAGVAVFFAKRQQAKPSGGRIQKAPEPAYFTVKMNGSSWVDSSVNVRTQHR